MPLVVEYRDDFESPIGQRGDHCRSGEDHIDDDDHLAGDAHAIQLFLAREDVNLMIEFDLWQH